MVALSTPVIEAKVHEQLRAFLREQGQAPWPHHLTMARLVARALRLGRSALIDASSFSTYQGHHRISYLFSSLMWPGPVVLVVPESSQQQIITLDLPRLRDWIPTHKPVQVGDCWPSPHFEGLLITTPEAWLADRLGSGTQFPADIPTLIDGVDCLEAWVRRQLTVSITTGDWEALVLAYPDCQERIRDVRVQLTHAVFQHPDNPYGCHLIEGPEQAALLSLHQLLVEHQSDPERAWTMLPPVWQQFWQMFNPPDHLLWVTPNRDQGYFQIHCGPVEVASRLTPIWEEQPVVLMGAALDADAKAAIFRQRLGLGDLTCLKFSPDRQHELIHLYLPDDVPLPNTPQFQSRLQEEVRRLVLFNRVDTGYTVVLIEDSPLRAQIGTALAAEFGSRVQVERPCGASGGILVAGWQYWKNHRKHLPPPMLLVIATLPIPSLEDPLVAGRVAYYKRNRQDWFRLYLLPTALMELQSAVAPVRDTQGMVALLDTRVHYRSYGRQILESLSPAACARSLNQLRLFEADCPTLPS